MTAAVFLLAFTGTGTGTGTDNVDVTAHLTGFLSGFGLGVWLAAGRLPFGRSAQRVAAGVASAVIALAWMSAVSMAALYR